MIKVNQFFFNPWENELLQNTNKTESNITFVCPFIKTSILKKILSFLPEKKLITFDIITRFDKSVFIQNSSDITAIDLLINYTIPNVAITLFKRNDLHAKIYFYDDNEMYITSSNLSFSGLNKNYEVAVKISDKNDIRIVWNKIKILKNKEDIITHDEYINMRNIVQQEVHQNMIKDESLFRGNYEDSDPDINDVVVEGNKLEQSIDLDVDIMEMAKKKVQSINKFIMERGDSDINQIEGKVFKSPNKPKIRQFELDENERNNFKYYWENEAASDEKLVKSHIKSIFSNIVSNNDKCLTDISKLFIHKTWLNSYCPERIEEVYLLEAGKALHKIFIVNEIIKKSFFNDQKIAEYHKKLIYIHSNYPYRDILSGISCNLILHMGTLPSNFQGEIYHQLLYILLRYIGFEKVKNFYNNYLNRTENLLFDNNEFVDYKSALNTFCSRRRVKLNYKLNRTKEPDHQKYFYIDLYCKNEKVASGNGVNINEAKNDAALNFFKKNHISYKDFEIKVNQRKQSKCFLNENRKKEISPIAKTLGIKNLNLLDIALTHNSYLNEHPESRSCRKLAYLGSYLDNFFRISNFIEWTKIKDAKKINSLLIALKHKSPTIHFTYYFDKMKLDKISNVIFQSNRNLSPSIKTDIVQAFVAITYIDKGFEDAKNFSLQLWESVYKEVENEPISCFVTQLQEIVQKSTKNGKIIVYQTVSHKQLEGNKNLHKVKCIIGGREFEVGEGPTKKKARQDSAKKTLKNKTFIDKYFAD